jgi:hypothetical protein
MKDRLLLLATALACAALASWFLSATREYATAISLAFIVLAIVVLLRRKKKR